eukprot:CAMPEP_0119548200 /NCGR_PEP_ID=MMETSP1352-20130426/2166_1 /TAXON_ID=265584 /ORGANISM="Stauroneis constricta, Strain CCMP1120" /LENGTH=429 /DNA_ID=CAMNT_0007593391 /DNA_START=158 /DNA_END=1447 /DNA_ORIENTATION=-
MTSNAASNETPAFTAMCDEFRRYSNGIQPMDTGDDSNNAAAGANRTAATYKLRKSQKHQNAKMVELQNQHWPMLANRDITWTNIEDYVDAMECIAILGGRVLLVSRQPIETHGHMMELGKIFVQTVQDPSEMEDDLDLLRPLLEFYHDCAERPRCDIWKATKWCNILESMNRRWEIICLMACTEVTVQLSKWIGLHSRQVMMISQSSFEDGGAEFSRVMEKEVNCPIKNLVLDTNEVDWDVLSKGIQACSALGHVFCRSDNKVDMDKCVQAIADNRNIHEAHVFGSNYDLDNWTRWLLRLIDCKHLRTIRYELDCSDSTCEAKKAATGDAVFNSIKSNGCVSYINFYHAKMVEESMWKNKIQEVVKSNLICEKVTETTNWIDHQTDKAFMLDCMFSNDKIRENKSALFKAIFGTAVLLSQLHQGGMMEA